MATTAAPPEQTPSRRRAALGHPTVATAVGGVLVLLGAAVAGRPLFDNSFFTHLATGRLLLDSGIPTADPYSYTAPGAEWTVQSWLASALYGWIDSWFGGAGVRVLAGLLGAELVALLWRLTRPARGLLSRVGITGLAIVVGAAFWGARPLMIGLVLLAATLVIVTEDRDPRWLVPLMWLWVNTHGSFPLGLVAIAAVAVGRRADGERYDPAWKALGWAALGTVLGMLGPMGASILTFPVGLLGRMEILGRVVEWQSPNFAETGGRIFLLQVAAVVAALVRKPAWRSAVPFVVFLAAALAGQRNVAVASIVFVVAMAPGLASSRQQRGAERHPVATGMVVVEVVVAVVLLVQTLAAPAFDLSSYPTDALAWLDQRGVLHSDARVLTQDTTGNLVELLWGTDVKVFLDDRYDMYPLPVLRDYLSLHAGAVDWEATLGRHGVDWLVWERNEPLVAAVAGDPDWRIPYQDGKAVVACRRGARAC